MRGPASSRMAPRFFFFFFGVIVLVTCSTAAAFPCRDSCTSNATSIKIKYPFGIDGGCGAPQYGGMLNCTPAAGLFFQTPSGSYKVQSIDYDHNTMIIFDPSISTCSLLQPPNDLKMTDIQSALIPPSGDTVVALLNCSVDSPVLNRYKDLCFNLSGPHSCDELYGACTAFNIFQNTPPCCFTQYSTLWVMNINILDCTHYTSFYNTDDLKADVGPIDWSYGIKLSFSYPETGCKRCAHSGGTCGFDVDTLETSCICSATTNHTSNCGGEGAENAGTKSCCRELLSFLQIAVYLLLLLPSINLLQ